jgi:hypothetical protein
MGQKLKVSGLNTEVILMKKCCAKNSIKIPESAIATLLLTTSIMQIVP